jgi:hypothetical protein
VSERTFRRWRDRYEAGLLDRRLSKAASRRPAGGPRRGSGALPRERCSGFTVEHFYEHLVKDHGFGWGYTWTKLHLQWAAGRRSRPGRLSGFHALLEGMLRVLMNVIAVVAAIFGGVK